MPDAPPLHEPGHHLVLIGNGEAHRYVAARAEQLREAGTEVTLVTRHDFHYADWRGGMLGGEWQFDELRLPAAAIARHGGRHLTATATTVDRHRRCVTLDSGEMLAYDAVSIDLPFEVDESAVAGFYTAQAVYGIGARDLWHLRQRLETHLATADADLPRVAVLGGGAPGVEFAANLLALGERYGRVLPVTLIDQARQPLPDACTRANRWLMQRLHQRGMRWELVASVARYVDGQLILDDGTTVDADYLLATQASRSPALVAKLDLAHDESGGHPLTAAMRSQEDAHLFLPCLARGVSPHERGPRLLEALLQAAAGAPRTPRFATERWQALNLGDLRDIAWRGRLWCRGRWVRRLKHRHDRREVARYLT